MEQNLKNKKVKIVYEDGDKVSSVYCTLIEIDTIWVYVKFQDGTENMINKNKIIKISEVKE